MSSIENVQKAVDGQGSNMNSAFKFAIATARKGVNWANGNVPSTSKMPLLHFAEV